MEHRSCRDLVLRFYEQLWNSWNDSAVDDTLASDFRFRGSLGQETLGRGGWRAYRDEIRRGAPDFHNEIIDLIDSGRQAAVRLKYSGTHLGQLLDIPATGRTFTYPGAAFFAAEGGKLTEAWVLGDIQALKRQLR